MQPPMYACVCVRARVPVRICRCKCICISMCYMHAHVSRHVHTCAGVRALMHRRVRVNFAYAVYSSSHTRHAQHEIHACAVPRPLSQSWKRTVKRRRHLENLKRLSRLGNLSTSGQAAPRLHAAATAGQTAAQLSIAPWLIAPVTSFICSRSGSSSQLLF